MSTLEWFVIAIVGVVVAVVIGISMYHSGRKEGKVEAEAEMSPSSHEDSKIIRDQSRTPAKH